LNFSKGDEMSQLTLPMLTVYEGPRLVPADVVAACKTYRDAVRMCWNLKPRTRMTRAQLAEETGCYASHVTDYLNDDEAKRDLPAKHINAFEVSCGNRLITQWMAAQAHFTILETLLLQKAA
jgi:hypothetical protein